MTQMTQTSDARPLTFTPANVLRRSLAMVLGAILVALASQVALPMAGTVVPLTFQVPAVVFVGVLLGARMGAGSMAIYLALGIAGLPVFAPLGVPSVGIARLLGPTGGYLLAYPVAAALAGGLAGNARSWLRLAAGLLAGMAAIYAGGVAQLSILSGGFLTALNGGAAPFVLPDLIKLLVVGLLLRRIPSGLRARLS
jgi:biotin transport system substrate-specific component